MHGDVVMYLPSVSICTDPCSKNDISELDNVQHFQSDFTGSHITGRVATSRPKSDVFHFWGEVF